MKKIEQKPIIVLRDKELRRLQLIQLDLLIEFDRVCRKNNIIYTIDGGTLLGAVRHKGFIPWDDDIDVAMTREEYEKFKKVRDQLDPKIAFLQDHDLDPNYLWGYAKLRRVGTRFVRPGQSHLGYKDAVAIDIFPMDDDHDSLLGRQWTDFRFWRLRKRLWAKVGKYTEKNWFKRMWYKSISHANVDRIYKKVQKRMDKSRNDSKHDVRVLLLPANGKIYRKSLGVHNSLKKRYAMKKEWLLDVVEYDFEGHKFFGSRDYHHRLVHEYGKDYMIPCGENQRDPHTPCEEYDFGGLHQL